MSQIGRSSEPLYQTRGRPVSWPIALTGPDGAAWDLTGATAEASLRWAGAVKPLTISDLDATGKIIVTGSDTLTPNLPLGRVNELVLSVTDSLGAALDFVWPVIGEEP